MLLIGIKIKFLTGKDFEAIKLSKKYKIRNFCLHSPTL